VTKETVTLNYEFESYCHSSNVINTKGSKLQITVLQVYGNREIPMIVVLIR